MNIIIINYNTFDMIKNTIDSILKYEKKQFFSITVIDNASVTNEKNKLVEYLDFLIDDGYTIKYILNDNNLGFGCANNMGMKLHNNEYTVLLNSDTKLTTNSLTKAVQYLESNPSVGAVGCRLITADGQLDHGCKRGFPTPKASLFYFLRIDKWFKRPELDYYRLGYLDEHQIHEVDAISGAFMVLRKEVIDQVGMFDERFFMYGEDLDLCYRIKEAGWRIVYNPDLGDVIHFKGSSAKKRKFKTLLNFYDSMIIFYNKHYLKKYNPIITLFVYLGVLIQFVLKLIKNYCFSQKQ